MGLNVLVSISKTYKLIHPVYRTCFETQLEVFTFKESPRQGLVLHAVRPVPHFPDHAFHFGSAVKVCIYAFNMMYC